MKILLDHHADVSPTRLFHLVRVCNNWLVKLAKLCSDGSH
jgi:hypothetical protein